MHSNPPDGRTKDIQMVRSVRSSSTPPGKRGGPVLWKPPGRERKQLDSRGKEANMFSRKETYAETEGLLFVMLPEELLNVIA